MAQTMFPLRPYQREGLDAFHTSWGKDVWRVAMELPTGGGKTVCFAHLAVEHIRAHPTDRVIVLVHTDELVDQAYKKMKDVAPHLAVGIFKAARRDVRADIIVASVQSLNSEAKLESIRHVGLVIVDECHHALANSYLRVLRHYGCFSNKCRAAGFTATFTRGDGKSLIPTWEEVSFSRSISWMVRKRYLKPPKGKAVDVPDLDLRGVKSTRSDYREGELGDALAESLAPELVAKAFEEHANERRGILFAPTVASAEVFADAFNAVGIKCEVVHGGMHIEARRNALARHRAGITRVIANCMVLTEGYDDPQVNCIIVARPTKSKGLYIQMVGRGLRVDPALDYEGQDCLILDVVGASSIHDLCSIADLSEREIKEKEAHSGKNLIEIEDAFDAGEGVPEEAEWYTGEVIVRDFDPLAAKSTKVWIKSTEGTYFVPAGKDAYVFIMQYPRPGEWSVAWCAKDSTGSRYICPGTDVPQKRCEHDPKHPLRPVGLTIHAGLSLEMAMGWAEDLAVDMGADTLNASNKKASWRSRPASEKMLAMARNLGIKVASKRDPETGLTEVTDNAGKVSDQITKILGSRRIDPLVRMVRERAGGQ
jgi:superfamily II DNA or RNA helicase